MTASSAVRALLTSAIDYAGLFPPAELSMRDAAARYAEYQRTQDAWALGRFVVPFARLDELVAARCEIAATNEPWRLSVLLGEDAASDASRISAFNSAHRDALLIDS